MSTFTTHQHLPQSMRAARHMPPWFTLVLAVALMILAAPFPVSVAAADPPYDTDTEITSITSQHPDGDLMVGFAIWVAVEVTSTEGTPTGNVSVTSGSGGPTCEITLSGGAGVCALFFTSNSSKTITASFAAQGDWEASSDSETKSIVALDLDPTLSAGRNHTCYLASDGSFECWGLEDAFDASSLTVTTVSAGGYHTCAIQTDGALQCWGDISSVIDDVPTGQFIALSAGKDHVCAIDVDHKLQCWGDIPTELQTIPTDDVKSISAGYLHNCAIKTDDTLLCWGEAWTSQPSDQVKAVAVGNTHACALKESNDRVLCWGSMSTPSDNTAYATIDSGSNYSCAQRESDDNLNCWGSGDPLVNENQAYLHFSSGFLHTCALQSKTGDPYLSCWGYNEYNQAPRIDLQPDAIQAYLPLDRYWSQTFTPSGGQPDYTLTNPGGGLPPGLGLSGYALSGTPTTAGAYNNFVLKAEEDFSTSSLPLELTPLERSYSTTIQDADTSLSLDAPDSATAGEPVEVSIEVDSTASATPVLTGTVAIIATPAGGGATEASCQADLSGSGNPGHATASCVLYFLYAGQKDITGQYAGSSFYNPSSEETIQIEIEAATINPMVSAGSDFNCSLDVNGKIYCWGKGGSGQTTPPTSSLYSQISAGDAHACARGLDGKIYCWGWNGYNVATPPTTASFRAVASGATHACALNSSGGVECWGNSLGNRTSPPAGVVFSQITAGKDHTCGLDSNSHARCWGVNASDVTSISFSSLSAGDDFTCGVRSTDELHCWGSGLASPPSGTFQAVDAGYDHACAIRGDDTLACWGDNTYGQTDSPSGVTFGSVSTGADHTCAIRSDGYMMCWGNNTDSQAPQLSISPATLPTIDVSLPWSVDVDAIGGRTSAVAFNAVPGVPPGLNLASNTGVINGTPTQAGQYNYTITAIEDSLSPGMIALLGERAYTQMIRSQVTVTLDAITPAERMVGKPVKVDVTVAETPGDYIVATPTLTVTVSADDGTTCDFTLSGGSGSCYLFFNTSGEKSISATYVGDDNFMPGSSASAPGGSPVDATMITVLPFQQDPVVRTGLDRTLVHKADGTHVCRGANCSQLSQLQVYPAVGVGDALACALQTDGQVLCKPNGLSQHIHPGQFVQLSVGKTHACAIDVHGHLSCWGEDGVSQGGLPGGVFSALSAGDDFSCAILASTGSLQCWGNAPAGTPSGAYAAVSVGPDHACAVATDGSLDCWGDDSFGQSAPPLGSFQAVSVGNTHSCALALDGSLACWGDQTLGRGPAPHGTFTSLASYADHSCALRSGPTLTCWGRDNYGEAPQITISPLTITEFPALRFLQHAFYPSGGTKPYDGEVIEGSLPPGVDLGVELSPAGVVLYGTPNLPGEYPFTLAWQDAAPLPLYLQQPFTLTITGADLGVYIVPSHPTTALHSNLFTFSYVISNTTSLTVPDVLLSVGLPNGLGGITFGGAPGCLQAGMALDCNIPSLDPYASLTLTVTGMVTAPLGTTISTTVAIQTQSPNWPEVQPSDNSDTASVQVGGQALAFYDPFDASPPDARWSDGAVLTTTTGISYLGDFDNSDSLRLTLVDLSPHKRVHVSFDLYVIGPWQGNTEVSPGVVGLWQFGEFGKTPLLTTTFCNDAGCTQAYPGTHPGGDYPWRSGASGWDELGYPVADTRYSLSFSFGHEADILDLLFSSLNLPPGAKWGLDNVRVILDSSAFSVYLPLAMR
ncbi:MAG: Ig-like domain repeat protein [Anaerolineales bacterium]|nr:Ig-like domain repeat protein [Anaerolineales bacterium]